MPYDALDWNKNILDNWTKIRFKGGKWGFKTSQIDGLPYKIASNGFD